jgi:hypothetical protein
MATEPFAWQPNPSHGNRTLRMATEPFAWQPNPSHGNRTLRMATEPEYAALIATIHC